MSELVTATYGPGDMAELGPTVGPVAPMAWGTVATSHGESWCMVGYLGMEGLWRARGWWPWSVLAFGMLLVAVAIAAAMVGGAGGSR